MGFLNINKYNLFMRQIQFFIGGTALGKGGAVRGCTPETIRRTETDLGKPMPLALKAWYQHFGERPIWYDYDADYSIRDLRETQEIVNALLSYEKIQWEHKDAVLAFSSRLGEQLLLVELNGEEDPPVYHYMEEDIRPTLVSIAFTTHVRSVIIGLFEGASYQEEYSRVVLRSNMWQGLETWEEKRKLFDDLFEEAHLIRKQLTEDIHQRDQKRGFITPPMSFQKQWIAEFSKSATWVKFQEAGLRMPYGWVCPPQLKKSGN
ncbi:MAG: hypothetical protein BroJett018_43010 [Chloroflexota bacterium]|nr:hypothetical protein [Chloroflexota bacterium]NOG65586.1 SMI1/KNR4 family protein [Chloroflexota bacterium]GIK66507.1 MAG: hypothetical protein BroJett018_43010 [Chloroflexota bacterium]